MKRLLRTALSPAAYHRLRLLKHDWIDGFSFRTWSQTGEDVILRHLFLEQGRGFYVDVGAHHPKRFSNTHYFYRRGWRGINIDAMPGSMAAFRAQRSRDVNLELGIGGTDGTMTLHRFQEAALNTFDSELAGQRVREGAASLPDVRVRVRTLASVLHEHVPAGSRIDFLTVDVEGLDLPVLQSGDWSAHRPRCVVAEADGFDLAAPQASPLHVFMRGLGYRLHAKTVASVFYLDDLEPPSR